MAGVTFEGGIPGYVEVHDRIAAFHEKYPEGSLQGEYTIRELPFIDPKSGEFGNVTTIIFKAYAYRTPDDQRPGFGHASEPVPGLTSYTRNSEIMNAETSAWGRALASLGFGVKDGVASANEVRAREGGEEAMGFSPGKDGEHKQRTYFERLLSGRDIAPDDVKRISAFANETLTRKRISAAIDALKDEEKSEATASYLFDEMVAWEAKQTSLPVDDSGLPPAEKVPRENA